MADQPWKTVGLKKKEPHSHRPPTDTPKPVERGRGVETLPPEGSPEHSPVRGKVQGTRNRKPARKTTKPVKRKSFRECVDELQPDTISELVEEVQIKYEDDPLNVMKEMHGQLQQLFSKAEPEKDYVFSSQPPGYPLCALSSSGQDALLKMVAQSPPLTQEKTFMYCVDLLLGELRTGTGSYGTRIMLLSLIECNNSVCVEAGNLIRLQFNTHMSKVPEALSLLWVGLPHPKLHPLTAIRTWPELCLSLFNLSNIPKLVLAYAVDYTCLLIRCVGEGNGQMLLKSLTPKAVSTFLTSPQLLGKRSQKNVSDLLDLSQAAVLRSASDKKLGDYFAASFKHLSADNPLPTQFAARCLQVSESSWEVWSILDPASSALLLKELNKCTLTSHSIPLELIGGVLAKVTKDRQLAQEVMTSFAEASEEVGVGGTAVRRVEEGRGERGSWCSVCGILILTLVLAYLALLAVFLHHIATQGPDILLDRVGEVVGAREVRIAWRATAYALNEYCSALLHYIPLWLHSAQDHLQTALNYIF